MMGYAPLLLFLPLALAITAPYSLVVSDLVYVALLRASPRLRFAVASAAPPVLAAAYALFLRDDSAARKTADAGGIAVVELGLVALVCLPLSPTLLWAQNGLLRTARRRRHAKP